jgi:hypothetical protein
MEGSDEERIRKAKVLRAEHPFVVKREDGCKEEPMLVR